MEIQVHNSDQFTADSLRKFIQGTSSHALIGSADWHIRVFGVKYQIPTFFSERGYIFDDNDFQTIMSKKNVYIVMKPFGIQGIFNEFVENLRDFGCENLHIFIPMNQEAEIVLYSYAKDVIPEYFV